MLFLRGAVVIAIALWVATSLPGIDVGAESTAGRIATLLVFAMMFEVVLTVAKPYIRIVALPLYTLTHGLFTLVVNAGLFWMTGKLGALASLPFHIGGFWDALWGSLIVSVTAVGIEQSLRV